MTEIQDQTVRAVYELPLFRLMTLASQAHQTHFRENDIQASSLLSIKTGGCPENCSYCPQSAHYPSELKKTSLMPLTEVVGAAIKAKATGASRFCMGAAWRDIKNGQQFDEVLQMVASVKELGLEVCCTLGMLNEKQAFRLKEAGLFAYNHNIDSSRNFYSKIIQTRTFDDRLRTIKNVRAAGLTVCTGGILGMGETDEDRIQFIEQLISLSPLPESITVNMLVPFSGTPLENQTPISPLEVIRVIGTIRIFAPQSMIRLSAGRMSMSEEAQFLCFLAGANSIFLGEKLLTSPNPEAHQDLALLNKLGYKLKKSETVHAEV